MNLRILIFILSMLAIPPIEALEQVEESKAKRVRLSIPSLPPDVITSIFGFMDYPTLARSRQVCKTWKTLIDEKLSLSQRYILKYLSQFVQKNNPERTIKRFEEIFLVPLSSESTGKTRLDDIIEELQEDLSTTKEQAYQALWSSTLVNTCSRIKLEIYADYNLEIEREFAFPYIPRNLIKQNIKHLADQNVRVKITGQQESPMQIFGISNLSEKVLGRITGVRLHKVNLLKIPRQFLKLQRLTQFNLNNSKMSSIPAEIGQLTNLQKLYLQDNQLSSIPVEIGQLTNLKGLGLSNNQLSNIPAEIGQLTNLQDLSLSNNQLSSIPTEIGQLTKLQELSLKNNQLSNIPAEIGQLTNLQELNLSINQLSSIPAEIGWLTNLRELYLRDNQLSSMPGEIKEALPNCNIII